jgi:putative oxygen-independent coproporphyrinogen III oxidase
MSTAIPLSLYIHLPWCVRKCPYCDFNSHAAGADAPRARYVDALIKDIEREAASGRARGRTIETVFLGGGTPSLFSGEEVHTIIENVRSNFTLSTDAEITLEANPGTTERDNLANYRLAGVNRLSLGAQSFSDESLKRLGRIHGRAEIFAAYDDALAAGFDNINLDLMFALPGQSLAAAESDINEAISLQPTHISWYQLTLEPNTVFYARPPQDIPDQDNAWQIQHMGQQRLAAGGYDQYEISAFARDGRRCRHNLNYWTFGDYLAVGAGAHGKFTDVNGRVWRYQKPAHPLSFMEQAGATADDAHLLENADLSFEYMLNALRLRQGFTECAFSASTGLEFDALADGIEKARTLELIASPQPGAWQPTERGLRFLNDLQALFLPTQGGAP